MRPKRCVHEQGEQRTDFNRAHERPSKVWVGAMAPRVALVRLAVLGRDRRRLCALPAALDATAVATVATPAYAAPLL